ncbi:extensin [Capsicum galapagoense]
MSNQRPFSWFRLAPFGRQVQPTPAPAPAPPPTPRPRAFRAPAPQPFRPPAPQPRPTIRPTAPAVTAPPPTAPTRALFPGTTTTQQPVPKSPTPSTAPGSPAKSIPATSVPASPIIKVVPSSSPTSPTLLPITSSSFNLRSPETKTSKPAASPPKTAPPAATTTTATAPTAATTTLSSRIVKPSSESPPKHPEIKPLFHPPAQARAAPQEEKKLMLGQETAGYSKMNEKSAMDNKKVTKFEKLPRRVVTLIGENKGAIMLLNPNSTKKSYTNVFGGKSQTVGKKEDGEMGSKKKKEDQNDMNIMEMDESTLFINSNVQGVNNSILDDSSFTDHDPGFHIFFSTD